MKLRLVLLLSLGVSLLVVGAVEPAVAGRPPVKAKAAPVPAGNGTPACARARNHLATLNAGVAPLNRQIDASKETSRERARLVAKARQLQRNIDAAAEAATAACKKEEEKPSKPDDQTGEPEADTVTPPADNGSAACRAVIGRITYLNGEIVKAVKNLKFRRRNDPNNRVALGQIQTRIDRLKADRAKAVEQGKTDCKASDFSGTWTGGWSGTFVSNDGCTIGERGSVTIQIAKTQDGYSVSETFHGLITTWDDDCAITETGDETFTSSARVSDGKLVGEHFTISGNVLTGEYSRTYPGGTETVRYSAKRG